MKAIPVGRTETGTLYFVIDGEENAAMISKNKTVHTFDLMSFLVKKEVDRIKTSKFHEFFWDGVDLPNNRWRNIVQYGVQRVPEEMLVDVDFLSAFPDKNKKRPEQMREKDDRAMEFKSLLAAEQHEKALARALTRGARRATGGVRGFIRNARFDPKATDADGDGWVQEGTQFARRVSTQTGRRARRRIVRAQDRLENADTVGMRSFSQRIGRGQMRWIGRSKEHYIKRHEDVVKKVVDRFNNGKPIKTYGDIRKALIRAHPGFANGTSSIDYLNGVDDDVDAEPGHIAHALGFMYGLIANPGLENVNFEIREELRDGVDGAAGWSGRHRVYPDGNGGIIMKADADKKTTIPMWYRTETSYQQVQDLRHLGNFQLEAHKPFFTLLQDVEPRGIPDPATGTIIPNPNLSDEDKAKWDEASRIASTMVTIHEMGHAAHRWVSMRDAMAAEGLETTDTLSVDLIRQRLDNYLSQMARADKQDAVRALIAQVESDRIALSVLQIGFIQSQDPDVAANLLFGNLTKPDGSGDIIRVNKELADWLNTLGRQMFPNPTGSRWKENDPMTLNAALNIFSLGHQGSSRPIFSDRDMPYRRFKPWNQRILAPRVEAVNGAKIPVPRLDLLTEYGLPRTPSTSALSPEAGQIIAEALIRGSGNITDTAAVGAVMFPDAPVTSMIPIPGRPVVTDALAKNLDDGVMDEVMKFLLDDHMRLILNSGDPVHVRSALELFFMATKYFDDLTPEEKRIAREIAMLGSGGEWASYMATYTQHNDIDQIFRFWDFELIAELIAANAYGNEIKLSDGDTPRSLTEQEQAVLAKIVAWIFPNEDFRLK